MVRTRNMTGQKPYNAVIHRLNRRSSSLKRPHTCKSPPARPSHPQYPASREVTHQECEDSESNITRLRRTGISATPVDWLPDIINKECCIVMERYEQYVSEIDDTIDLDSVRRAFVLVKAQACMLATLFIRHIRQFLLPTMKDTRSRVLGTEKEATENARYMESTINQRCTQSKFYLIT